MDTWKKEAKNTLQGREPPEGHINPNLGRKGVEKMIAEESSKSSSSVMMDATYSPEDNKLRLYATSRLDPDTYARVRAAGFIWAPKQELFVAPMWTPQREDLLLELCGEIGDEDTSLVERSEERAERFQDYKHARAEDAERANEAVDQVAKRFEGGQPILVGHHSEKRARKDAERIENGMRKAVKLWETSQYWQHRAAGAIRAAKYKERPDVRGRRIKGLEADLRKQEKTKKDAQKLLHFWEGIHDDNVLKHKDGTPCTLQEKALFISNYDHISRCFPLSDYPREKPASQYEGQMSLWSALDNGVIASDQAREIAIPSHRSTISWCDRWIRHIQNRLTYERAMLHEAGGTVTDRKGPEKGGACRCWCSPGTHSGMRGWSYIQKVNKVSVTVLDNWGNGGRNFTRTIPFHDLKEVMTAEEVREKREALQLIEDRAGDPIGFFLRDAPPPAKPEEKTVDKLEKDLRDRWTKEGVPKEKQDAIIADATAKAQPGAHVGPFVIGEDPKAAGERFRAMRDTLKKGIKVVSVPQLFPTPPGIAAHMIELADIRSGDLILEPSAGTGNLLRAVFDFLQDNLSNVRAVEINLNLVDMLRLSFPSVNVMGADFLTCDGNLGRFDRIVMNPPFENGADIEHIRHAMTMLNPGGRLVALCANGPRQREAFMDEAEHWEDLPAGSFKDSGTSVNVALMVLYKPVPCGYLTTPSTCSKPGVSGHQEIDCRHCDTGTEQAQRAKSEADSLPGISMSETFTLSNPRARRVEPRDFVQRPKQEQLF